MINESDRETAANWHVVLLGLAGRVSDDTIARCRELLAEGHVAEVGVTF